MNKLIRSLFASIFAVTLGLALAGCSGSHEKTVVGKWKTSQGGGGGPTEAMVTFTKDGKMISEQAGKTENGVYTLSTSNTVNLQVGNMPIEFGITFTSPDEMSLTPQMAGGMAVPAGQAPAVKFTRVSQ